MSDSEDDFMSDKFLIDAAPKPTAAKTYAEKRKAAEKQHLLNQKKSLKTRELEARRKGFDTSLFELHENVQDVKDGGRDGAKTGEERGGGGGNKAMEMMMKMGWKVGEGLGKKDDTESDSTTPTSVLSENSPVQSSPVPTGMGGIGSLRKRQRPTDLSDTEDKPAVNKQRLEPIRVSMWEGKSGLGTRQKSPSPPLVPGELHPAKLAQLESSTEDFRKRQSGVNEAKKIEGQEWAARKLVVEFDEANGIKFHPLHVIPTAPAQTIPIPLLRLLFQDEADVYIHARKNYLAKKLGAGPGGIVGVDDTFGSRQTEDGYRIPTIKGKEKADNLSEANRLREMMKMDALSSVADEEDEEEGDIGFGVAPKHEQNRSRTEDDAVAEDKDGVDAAAVDWEAQVDGVKRVLAMEPSIHLAYLIDMLRMDHRYCFWCGMQYSSLEEMEGTGGCPGENEDDH